MDRRFLVGNWRRSCIRVFRTKSSWPKMVRRGSFPHPQRTSGRGKPLPYDTRNRMVRSATLVVKRVRSDVLAGRQGLEPRFTGPEPVVLPLNDLPVVRGNADYPG